MVNGSTRFWGSSRLPLFGCAFVSAHRPPASRSEGPSRPTALSSASRFHRSARPTFSWAPMISATRRSAEAMNCCGAPGLAQEPIIKSPEKGEFTRSQSLDRPLKCECDVNLASKGLATKRSNLSKLRVFEWWRRRESNPHPLRTTLSKIGRLGPKNDSKGRRESGAAPPTPPLTATPGVQIGGRYIHYDARLKPVSHLRPRSSARGRTRRKAQRFRRELSFRNAQVESVGSCPVV